MQPQPAREKNTEGAAPTCQALPHFHEPCSATAITRCVKRERWFCAVHAMMLSGTRGRSKKATWAVKGSGRAGRRDVHNL